MRGSHDLGMVRQPEVIVRTHVQKIGATGNGDVRLLGRGEHALAFEQTCFADLVDLGREVLFHGAVHGVGPFVWIDFF